MKPEKNKKHTIPIIITILAIVVMLPVIISLLISLWPVFLLILFGFLIFGITKLIFCKQKTEKEINPPTPPVSPAPQPETEFSIKQKAFGLLQQRITGQLEQQYPGARWVWDIPNAIERFRNNEPLIIFLNSAGGYNKAQVIVHDLLFKGLYYITLETEIGSPTASVESPKPEEEDTEEDFDESLPEDTPVNYERLAFEWVNSNIIDINTKYNEAIAHNKIEMLIPAEDLPHPDSWPDLCGELKRNGFTVADFCEDGIKVNIAE